MLSTHLGASADLPPWAVIAACALAATSLVLLLVELRRHSRENAAVVVSGLLAVSALLGAVLRPARVSARESPVGARVVVLADASRSMALAGDDGRPRRAARDEAIARLAKSGQNARLVVLGFGEGPAAPLPDALQGEDASSREPRSDLAAAVRALAASPEERPAAVVVVSDGRLDNPPAEASEASLRALGDELRVPIDTIATTRSVPADASIRRVSAAGAAVAHVPLPLRVEVGCAGGLACDELTVSARELRDDGPPAVLSSGVVHVDDGKGTIDLTITLERAGTHIVEVAVAPPAGDTIPANDRRLVTFNVSRERVRVLHVAGHPTNDVRALRQWLKSDASVDVVAFFILRTPTSDVRAGYNDLALIPFPVDELFQDHLPSFDAIVLQDFDAQPYGLEKYLENIRHYVRSGGGLVMVGGQNSFVAGGYAGTPLAEVLPVALDGSPRATSADTSPFVPQWTPEGRTAPLLGPLRDIVGDALPEMPGANVLGDARPGGVVLWSHPTLTTPSGAKMPVLAIGDEGDGRTIALGVDGAWEPRILGARRENGGPRARRALGRPPRLADARSPLRARADGDRGRMHRGPAVAGARAPLACGAVGHAQLDRGGEGHPRRDANRPAERRRPRRTAATSGRDDDRLAAATPRSRRLRRAASNGGRGHDAKGLRLRGRRRRMGRFAPGPAAARSPRTGHRRRVRERIRRRRALAPEAHPDQRRAPRDPSRPRVALVALGGLPPRRPLAGAAPQRPDVSARVTARGPASLITCGSWSGVESPSLRSVWRPRSRQPPRRRWCGRTSRSE